MMQKDENPEEDIQKWVKEYESMRQGRGAGFLDPDAFESVIYHYVNSDQPEKAREACEFAMEMHPYHSELLLDYAHVLYSCGQTDQAMVAIKKAEPFFPHDVYLIVLKCTLLNLQGRHKEAIQFITQIDPHLVEKKEILYHILGGTFAQMGNNQEARYWFKKSLDIDPTNLDCLEEFLIFLEDEESLEDSLPYFQKIIDANPFDPTIWLCYSNVLNKIEQFEEALSAVDYCLAIDESLHAAHFHKGNIWMNLERYSDAEASFLEAVGLNKKNPNYLVGLGASLELQQKPEKAIQHFRKALKLNPAQDDAYFGIGSCLLAMKKLSESIHFFKKSLQYDPENPGAWLSIALAEFELGNLVSADEAFEKVYELDPENHHLWLDWSYMFFESGFTEKAISMIKEAISIMPDEALLYYRASAYHFVSGELREAILFLENALLLDYDSHTVLYEFFTDLQSQKELFKIIKELTDKNN
jgi:tetratricopeptide (TPR) repeat protein